MKKLSLVLLFSGIVFLMINFYLIHKYGLDGSRWARLATTSCYFLLYLATSAKKNIFLIITFCLFLVSDIALFEYEIPIVKKITFILVILAYVSLMLHIQKYVRNLKATTFQKILFGGVLAINIGMLYFLTDMVENRLDDNIHAALFYVYGMCMIVLVILAFSFSNRYSNQASFYFIAAVLGFIFSDITSFIAYYLELGEFYYPDRLFYLLGLICLVKFAGLDKKEGMLISGEFL